MRVIGGKWKGRKLNIPSKNWPVRPTTDFAREALFNILDNRIDYENISALDLFGGTGVHTIELASRGCGDLTYVDRHRQSTAFMKAISLEWDIPVNVINEDVNRFISTAARQWDYIFADPPYEMKGIAELPLHILRCGILTDTGFFVLEHKSSLHFQTSTGFSESRQYGQSTFTFFKPAL
jgi:16S rRNA (guanine966-N2)-methyltransferase